MQQNEDKMFNDCIALANLRSTNLILIILQPWAASRVLKFHRRSVVVQRLLLPSQMTPNISPQFIKKSISRLQHQSFKKHTHRDMLQQNVTLTFPSICLHRGVALFVLSSPQQLCSQFVSQLCSSHRETDVNIRLEHITQCLFVTETSGCER